MVQPLGPPPPMPPGWQPPEKLSPAKSYRPLHGGYPNSFVKVVYLSDFRGRPADHWQSKVKAE